MERVAVLCCISSGTVFMFVSIYCDFNTFLCVYLFWILNFLVFALRISVLVLGLFFFRIFSKVVGQIGHKVEKETLGAAGGGELNFGKPYLLKRS